MRSAPRVAIIGAGIAGISMGANLRSRGIESFTIFEKADGPGGTWRDNRFPGAACDVPSHLYSFSFAPNPRWSRIYARQPEILDYLERTAQTFGIVEHCRFNTTVVRVTWDAGANEWNLELHSGEAQSFDFVVSCVGLLNEPRYPPLPGLGDFAGPVMHTARWDPDVDLTGQRVGVIGTGSTSAQVTPALADLVAHLHVFQRQPGWVLPKKDRAYSPAERLAFASSPRAPRRARLVEYLRRELNATGLTPGSRVHRRNTAAAHAWLDHAVDDPDLRAALTPDYAYGCKRPVKESAYYPALGRDNVTLVADAVLEVTSSGVRADGQAVALDVLVLATGFLATEFLRTVDVVGRHGRRLHEVWEEAGGPEAVLGVMVTGFPNLLILYGPNTNSSTTSLIFVLERQAEFAARTIVRAWRRSATVEVGRRTQTVYNRWLHAKMSRTTWASGCTHYFSTASGKLVTNWPHTSILYAVLLRLFRPSLRPIRAAARDETDADHRTPQGTP